MKNLPLVVAFALLSVGSLPVLAGDAPGHAEALCPLQAEHKLLRAAAAGAVTGTDTDTGDAGLPEACSSGLRPGARMTSPAICTFNFVFSDGGRLYIGTVGHCVSGVGQRVSANGVGSFGTVVYRLFGGGSGDDFALILIDQDKETHVDARMCTWGGPHGVQTGGVGLGGVVYEYGWGIATQFTAATRSRVHAAYGGGTTITWNGVGSGGDSGAPVVTMDGNAYGIHTFGLTPIAGVVFEGGPHIQHILAKTRAAGFAIDVVTV